MAPSSDASVESTSLRGGSGLNTLTDGTLFGQETVHIFRKGVGGLNTLTDGHPLRTSGDWLEWRRMWEKSLNTLTDGHPLRTRCKIVAAMTSKSQYPH